MPNFSFVLAWWAGQDPSQWNVDDVVRFVSSLIDSHAADLFKNQVRYTAVL